MSAFKFRRNGVFQCFFCQATTPSNVNNFKCTSCGCWNRYNDNGEILSYEPAMHDENLNARSFAKRGSPSKVRLPNFHGPGPFCHNCQTNQMLQLNLLSNYLPDSSSPDYQPRLEMLQAYRESLNSRYPPVCTTCVPLVEDEIHRKEQMARVQAFGGWLSKGKERQRHVSDDTQKTMDVVTGRTLFWWRTRGFLWALSILFSMVGYISAIFEFRLCHMSSFVQPVLPLVVIVSLFWTAWDPTYVKLLNAQKQSRHVSVHGKYFYNVLQLLVWVSRLICSTILSILWFYPNNDVSLRLSNSKPFFLTMVCIELSSLIGSSLVLRIHQSPSVRLVDKGTHKHERSQTKTPEPRSTSPSPVPPRLSSSLPENDLTSLSLSSKPVFVSSHKPLFGFPSLKGPVPVKENVDNEMDWTPTAVTSLPADVKFTEDWLRPQRFFASAKVTGLEELLEETSIQEVPMVVDVPDTKKGTWLRLMQALQQNRAMSFLCLAALVIGLLFAKKLSWTGLYFLP